MLTKKLRRYKSSFLRRGLKIGDTPLTSVGRENPRILRCATIINHQKTAATRVTASSNYPVSVSGSQYIPFLVVGYRVACPLWCKACTTGSFDCGHVPSISSRLPMLAFFFAKISTTHISWTWFKPFITFYFKFISFIFIRTMPPMREWYTCFYGNLMSEKVKRKTHR